MPGRMYDVRKLYLEDVLPLIRYETDAMRKIGRSEERTAAPRERRPEGEAPTPGEPLEPSLQSDVDDFLDDCCDNGSAVRR